ncbi:hypothetical protein P3T37_000329 [Kitasatospora sp. MAA4]|uniref:hypothetical protein n=1 Tax=Kitasatospora sp. MAA4 TaxID=3035093 RepID=UPI002474476E|nr:hypothetical protein [Kitasatospora sp. MAA4]MDH6130962.1 hypothetical protein [Kitasatospora sp. MAA4]
MYYGDLVPHAPGLYANERELADNVLAVLEPHFHIQREVPGGYPSGKAVRLDAVVRPRDPAGWFDLDPVLGVEFKLPESISGYRDFGAQIAQAADYNHCAFDAYGRLTVFLCPSPVADLLNAKSHFESLAARNTIEYQRKMARTLERIGRPDASEEEIEAAARSRQQVERKRLETVEAGAKAEGYKSTADRDRQQALEKARFAAHLLGQLGVGELMPHRTKGWTLLRSGEHVWSQQTGPVRCHGTVRPKVGSR